MHGVEAGDAQNGTSGSICTNLHSVLSNGSDCMTLCSSFSLSIMSDAYVCAMLEFQFEHIV
jgi:hypothetical protein